MLSLTTKEAIKVGLSIAISICLALWFGWEKPYWAAIAVVVMAVNESFAHSIQKGKNRILGTLLGTTYVLLFDSHVLAAKISVYLFLYPVYGAEPVYVQQ